MFEIYGTSMCFWCQEAKDLLKEEGIEFKFFNIEEPKHLKEFQELFPGKKTVPQILEWNFERYNEFDYDWVSTYIGGYDNLHKRILG